MSKNEINKLKIEIDAKGKIVVGGLKDKNTLKKVEDALNGVSGLADRIDNFQLTEQIMYRSVRELNITNFQVMEDGTTLTGMDLLEHLAVQTEDIDSIEGLRDPLAYACLEYFRDPIESADFSHKDKGLANPKGDMEKALRDVRMQIQDKLNIFNQQRGMNSWDENAINWSNGKVRITESGSIEFEGRFSKSEEANNYAQFVVREALQEAMMASEDGTESIFTTALQRITMNHDAEYGDGEEIGVKKESVFEFSLNSTNTDAYVIDKSGEAEKRTHDAIKKDVAALVNAENPGNTIDAKSISVGKDGKLSFNGTDNLIASSIVDQVNHAMLTAKQGGKLDTSTSINKLALDIMKKMSALNAYGPDADKKYLNYKHEEDEEWEYMDRKKEWMKNQSYPYSTWTEKDSTPLS